jgi:hemerythrin superfamily protein
MKARNNSRNKNGSPNPRDTTRTTWGKSTIGGPSAPATHGEPTVTRSVPPTLTAEDAREDNGMKATALLKRQHREVEKLFSTALKTQNPNTRRQATDSIIKVLEHHTQIEEDIFYPAVREIGTKKAEDMIGEAYEEHHVVKLVLAELPSVDPKADNFEAKMTVLKELVGHHVKEEEDEMFPMAEKKLGEDRSSELAEEMAGPKAA